MIRLTSKTTTMTAVAVMAFAMLLSACGGPSTGNTGGNQGNLPASNAEVTATTEAGAAGSNASGSTSGSDAAGAATDASGGSGSGATDTGSTGTVTGTETVTETVTGTGTETATETATDVGSGSDGAQGGGSNGATGTTSPDAATAGDNAPSTESGNTGSGTTGDATGGNTGAAYSAVSNADCTAAQQQLSQALGVDVSMGSAPATFADLSGGAGESCQLTVTGTGAQFNNMPDTAQRIAAAFTAAGWTADTQYVADSPTGTVGGLRKGNQLAAYNVGWEPAAGVTCPEDQPISACADNLTPEQMNYTITVDLAQR